MFQIEQQGSQWIVRDGSGNQVGDAHATYELALGVIAASLAATLAAAADDGDGADMEDAADATSEDGLLPERWHSTTGVAFQQRLEEETPRDFTTCEWTYRDASVYPLPLMDQTCTDVGHFGAELAGYADTNTVENGTAFMAGRFYDSPAGRAMRDRMLSGNRVGVSVDPGELDVEFVCTEQDDDGWCNAGEYAFLAYQIIGLTGTPFPGFEGATIELDTGTAAPAAEPAPAAAGQVRPVAASAGTDLAAPIAPPSAWFSEPEPELGDPRLIEQQDGSLAVPLTITDDGQVYGHVARWGQCHIADPAGPDVCVTPPETADYDLSYHLTPLRTAEGTEISVGPLTMGCDHANRILGANGTRDHYANSGSMWANVRATNGVFGPWVCGSLVPTVTPLQLRILRSLSLSGDWRELDEFPGQLAMVAGLAVPVPGFPIARQALAASGMHDVAPVTLRAGMRSGRLVSLVASGIVQPCPDCARRAALAANGGAIGGRVEHQLAEILRGLDVLDRRTAHLRRPAADALAARLGRSRS